MNTLKLIIVTPKKKVWEGEILGVTVPSKTGEITILPRHSHLFSLLEEGIVKIILEEKEDYYAVGGGYVETDGKEVSILVSKAYGEVEMDEQRIKESEE